MIKDAPGRIPTVKKWIVVNAFIRNLYLVVRKNMPWVNKMITLCPGKDNYSWDNLPLNDQTCLAIRKLK